MAAPQSVLHGGKVYVAVIGVRVTDSVSCLYLVFRYDPGRDVWSTLPPCPVYFFGLGQFQGHLIAVGGSRHGGEDSGKVYRYKKESRKWKEYLKPMPTGRSKLSVITTESAIIACGGRVKGARCSIRTVEVHTVETDQ